MYTVFPVIEVLHPHVSPSVCPRSGLPSEPQIRLRRKLRRGEEAAAGDKKGRRMGEFTGSNRRRVISFRRPESS